MGYTGLGAYPQQPPERPDRAPLWIALAVVGVLVLVGGATALVLLDPGSGTATTGSSAPAPTSTTPAEPDWQAVDDSRAGLAYELPPTWESTGGGTSGRVRLTASHVSRPFECQGRSMIQAQAVSGSVVEDDLEQVATELVNRMAAGGYAVDGTPPAIGEPRVESADDEVVRLSVEVTPRSASACYAPKATISAVALRNGGEVAVFALNLAEGGPHVAEGPSDDDVARILGSVRLP